MIQLGKKTTATMLIAIFMISTFAVLVSASPGIELGTFGNGIAEWSTKQIYIGSYSVKLYVENGVTDWAEVSIPVDIALGEIIELKFWEYIESYAPTGWSVNVLLGVDADCDGDFEADVAAWHQGATMHTLEVLHGDSFVQMDGVAWCPNRGVWNEIDARSVSQWWTPDKSGDGFAKSDTYPWTFYGSLANFVNVFLPDETQTSLIQDTKSRVLYVKLLIGGSGSWMKETAYIDDVTINSVTYELEPPSLPDTNAPIVSLDSPTDGSFVSGIVDIYGTVTEDVALSHYNIAIYPGDADFNDFSKRLEQETVYRSSGFENLLIYHWDTTKYDDGEYLIRLAARDAAGNRDLSGNPYSGGDDSQHVIRVTVDNVPTKATVDINPDTLNLKGNGQWITAYIELPEGYSVEDIEVGSIKLESSVLVDPEAPIAIGDYDDDGVPDLMVKFDRQAVKEAMSGLVEIEVNGDVKFFSIELTVTGKVAGTSFEGIDSIKVIRK